MTEKMEGKKEGRENGWGQAEGKKEEKDIKNIKRQIEEIIYNEYVSNFPNFTIRLSAP